MKEWATHNISIRKSTKNRLKTLGTDTYDGLITRLLDHWEKTHKNNRN